MHTAQITPDYLRNLIAELTSRIAGRALDANLQIWLNEEVGPQSNLYQDIETACKVGLRDGWLCNERYPGGTRFGRIFEPASDLYDYSVDVVEMINVAAPYHIHPKGEIDLILPQEEGARFEGHGAGWLVQHPGSGHSPVVEGGRALILYMLPGGEIQFTP
ncbi:DUF4863 family protein [Pectobacterium aroidearum]|uniref:4-hydroxylaminobenzoate lyase n=1 Tax=Pectobacterium aroidearum TaxID=1201031 RepID=UPI0031593360